MDDPHAIRDISGRARHVLRSGETVIDNRMRLLEGDLPGMDYKNIVVGQQPGGPFLDT